VPPDARSLDRFLTRFADVYAPERHRGQVRLIAAASHHRLAWIHPFLDGNGRVTRFFTDAYLGAGGTVGHGLWSASRGLARNRAEYLDRLAAADAPRRNDYDGRGNLSLAGLADFCRFFLQTCIDQARFMGGMLATDDLHNRAADGGGALSVSGGVSDGLVKERVKQKLNTKTIVVVVVVVVVVVIG